MPVSRLHRPSRGSRRPGRWRLGPARARSSPWSSITVSTPREEANSTNPNFSTFPPPDHGLHSRTGCKGGVTRCTRPAAVVRRLAANAARAARTAMARSARQMSARTKDSQSSLPAPSNAATRTAAPTTIPMMPVPAARGSFRDRPPPAGDAEREAGRSDNDVHAVANQEADQRDSEQQDRDEREDGEGSLSSRRGATRVRHVASPTPVRRARHEILLVLASPERRSLRLPLGCGHHRAPFPGLLS